MIIRKYNPNDKESLLNLLALNSPKYFDFSEKETFINYLNNEIEDYFVIAEKNKIIGCGGINYFKENKEARISWDMIHPEHHGKGIGKKLMTHRLNVIKENKDINTIIVRTSQFVYPFYEKMGFNLQKIEKDFWAKNIDMYLMTMQKDYF